ncbi:unnamed protein product [Rhizophagus irregularis]|uniref:Uncharacterized protein n=1 Tax=Rhizophagus irregularis TaxID=588596 RepID=A0A915YTM2_9GLOM|nr:hypothetical protein RIR_jg40943.t1 [Rhizophagus irregularis DAOM 181602=DAOM 197198]CAB4486882.1 unnamed protein product [Rhizophagus irregularis]CAB5174534.1 unnamed protein product [Rhizophagus irregularis]CAB5335098.1 unnamed protein product [Rhizophagus irregularis]
MVSRSWKVIRNAPLNFWDAASMAKDQQMSKFGLYTSFLRLAEAKKATNTGFVLLCHKKWEHSLITFPKIF